MQQTPQPIQTQQIQQQQTQPHHMIEVDEDWYTVDLESRLNKKMDVLQTLVHQQSHLIQQLSAEILHLKSELSQSKTVTHTQNDRTHQLLEELKIIKQRELNWALRSHLPVPWTPSHFIQSTTPLLLLQASRGTRSPIMGSKKATDTPFPLAL